VAETRKFIARRFFTPAFAPQLIEWVTSQNLEMPRALAAQLLLDHGAQDWRDVFSRITLPTLVVGAEKSLFTVASQQWIADQIPGAKLEIFKENGREPLYVAGESHEVQSAGAELRGLTPRRAER
jgi:pimeloyl-ACP methyl ester carboxylesterase